MELKLILMLARRWAWLLTIGVILGTGGAYVATSRQAPVYVASTKVMVFQAPRSSVADVQVLSDRELTQTYLELLLTRRVIAATSAELGFGVSSGQISAQRIGTSGLLEVVARDSDPERAAAIANEVVNVLIAQNEELQASLFASTEESLQAQIAQVEAQMGALQTDISASSEETLESRQEQMAGELAALEETIYALQSEIAALEVEIEAMTPQASLNEPPPTLSAFQQEELGARRTELAQKRFQLGLTEGHYGRLAVATTGGDAGTAEQQVRTGQQQTTFALYQQIYSNLLSSYEAVRLARLQSTAHVIQVEEAVPPVRPVHVGLVNNLLLGAAVGLIVTGSIAFLIEYLDESLKTPADFVRATGLPVIGSIMAFPRDGKKQDGAPFVINQPHSPQAEAFRSLYTNLEFVGTERPLKTILFTSPTPGEGKSTTIVNLAMTMFQAHQKVVLLDCDLRQPVIHKLVGVGNRVGVGDYLTGRVEVENALLSLPVARSQLTVVTSGSLLRYPTERLRSERMNKLLDYLKDSADTVLIDSPPLTVADAAVLASKVDGVVLVMQPGRSNVETAQAVIEQLNRVGAHMIGIVLTRVSRQTTYYQGLRDLYRQQPGSEAGRRGIPPQGGRLQGLRVAVQKLFAILQ